MREKIENFCEKHEKSLGWLLLTGIMILAVLMYQYTPRGSDDFIYMNQWGSKQPLRSLSDIIYFQQMHYMTWGGRAVAHTIVQLMFLIGRPVSSLLNAAVFLLLGYMIHLCGFRKKNMLGWVFSVSLLYYLNSCFDETISWATGNGNYMWTTVIILINAYPFVRYLKESAVPSGKQWLLLPFAFLAGWTNENMAPTMVLFMAYVIYEYYREHKKVNAYFVTALILSLIGTALLILAPGNNIRSEEFSGALMSLAYRGHGQINAWFNWLFLPIVVTVILYVTGKMKQAYSDREKKFIYALAAWFVLSVLVMIASPTYPERATFGSLVLLLILIDYMIDRLTVIDPKILPLVRVLYIACAVGFVFVLVSVDLLAFVRASGVYIPG